MRFFISVAVFVCRWWMVCGIGRCPFPGITAHAKFQDDSINWKNRRSFQEGDVVEYKCSGYSWPLSATHHKLTCRSDGTWNQPLPQCDLRIDGDKFEVKYGQNSFPWTQGSCSSNQISDTYSVKFPSEFKNIDGLYVFFCQEGEENSFHNSSLDQVEGCRFTTDEGVIAFDCIRANLEEIQHSITIHMKHNAGLSHMNALLNPENHCGWPPVPVNADVATDVIQGKTTNVTYKCKDPFVLDPNGPQFSTCDQVTGQWPALPKCICADPLVPAYAHIVSRTDFSVQFQCDFPFHLNGFNTVVCDDTGTWGQLPSCDLGHFPILAVTAIALLILIVVLLLVLILKIKRMCCFKQTKSSVAVTNEVSPDRRGLIHSNFYEPPGWPSVKKQPTSREEPIYQRIGTEKHNDI